MSVKGGFLRLGAKHSTTVVCSASLLHGCAVLHGEADSLIRSWRWMPSTSLSTWLFTLDVNQTAATRVAKTEINISALRLVDMTPYGMSRSASKDSLHPPFGRLPRHGTNHCICEFSQSAYDKPNTSL